MKKLISILIIAAAPTMLFAQTAPQQGLITYRMSINLREQAAKQNPAVASMVPEKMYAAIKLTFNKENFAVVTEEEKAAGNNPVQNAMQIMMSGLGSGKQIYNLKTKTVRVENTFNGRNYYTEGTLDPSRAIAYTSETKKILGYTCNKAVVTGTDKVKYTVWYTTAIPYAYNPEGDVLTGLKGAVLECIADDHSVTATGINPKAFSAAALTLSANSKKVTNEQMEDLQEGAVDDMKSSVETKLKAGKK
ncbi:GLPGLI family protein [Chitinophagaceae bacterium MMS25-I14]